MNRIAIATFAAVAAIGAGSLVVPGQAAQKSPAEPVQVAEGKIVNRMPETLPTGGRVVRVVYPSHLTAQR